MTVTMTTYKDNVTNVTDAMISSDTTSRHHPDVTNMSTSISNITLTDDVTMTEPTAILPIVVLSISEVCSRLPPPPVPPWMQGSERLNDVVNNRSSWRRYLVMCSGQIPSGYTDVIGDHLVPRSSTTQWAPTIVAFTLCAFIVITTVLLYKLHRHHRICKPSIFAEYHKQRVETVDYCTPGNHGYISPSVTIETQLSLCALGDEGSYTNLSSSRPSVNNDQYKRYSRYSEYDSEYYSDNYSRIRGDTSLRDVSASSDNWDLSSQQHHEILLAPAQLQVEDFTTRFPTQYTPATSCADVSYCSLYEEFGSDARNNRRGVPPSSLYSTVDSEKDEYSCYVELHDSRVSRDVDVFQGQQCINTRDRMPDQYGRSKRLKNAMRKCKNVGASFVDGVKNKSLSISARVKTANLFDESDSSKKSSSFKTLKRLVPPLRRSRLRSSKSKSVNAFKDAHYSNETVIDINDGRDQLHSDNDTDKEYTPVTLQSAMHNVSNHSLEKSVANSEVSNYWTRINDYISKGKRRLPKSKTNESISSSIGSSSQNGHRNTDAKRNPSCKAKSKRPLLGRLTIPSVLRSTRKV